MRLATHLSHFTTLTPPELSDRDSPAAREHRKSMQQRAEDFIYTLNHAVTCLSLTDFLIAPFFASVFGWNICGHGHDHSKDGGHGSSGGSAYSGASSAHVHGPGCGHDVNLSNFTRSSQSGESTLRASIPQNIAMHPISPEALRAQGNATTAAQDRARLEALLQGKGIHIPPSHEATPEIMGPPKPPHLQQPQPAVATPTPPEPKTFWEKTKAQWSKAQASTMEYLKKHYPNFKEWFIGEAVGDLGAVPVTLAVQHFTPGIMTGIQHGLEPIVGRLMRARAEKAAARWADSNGIARDARDVVDHAESLYQYEIRHLPQMAMWTLSSCAINYGVMKYRNPAMELATFTKGKVAGAAITAGLVFGTRTLAPEAAHRWDETMGRRVVVPVTKKVGRIFGIEEKEVDAQHEKHHGTAAPTKPASNWADKLAQATPAFPAARRA